MECVVAVGTQTTSVRPSVQGICTNTAASSFVDEWRERETTMDGDKVSVDEELMTR